MRGHLRITLWATNPELGPKDDENVSFRLDQLLQARNVCAAG
jgi:hypothetical protein